jgi:hypothetical protein
MIDEKKIQEAAAGMFNAGSLMNAAEQIAFERGVYWFKKSLWHPAKEKPILQKGSHALVELYDGRITLWKTWRVYEAICNRKGYVVKWCYIEDLLPKGSEK